VAGWGSLSIVSQLHVLLMWNLWAAGWRRSVVKREQRVWNCVCSLPCLVMSLLYACCIPRTHTGRSVKRTPEQANVPVEFILPVHKTQTMIYHYYSKVG
jgi:hypothetical protein